MTALAIAATYVAQGIGYLVLVGGFVWWVATSSRGDHR